MVEEKLKKISDFNLNIDSDNYGIIEDIHSSIFHIISQSLRMMYSYKKLNFFNLKHKYSLHLDLKHQSYMQLKIYLSSF